MDIRDQWGRDIHNVQGNQYIQQTVRERESFARDIAATKTRARILVWLGLLMLVGGSFAFMLPIVRAINDFDINSMDVTNPFDMGPEFAGYKLAFIGFIAAFIGQFVLLIGIILHVIAASRRKRLLNLPPLDMPRYRD